MPDLSRSSVYAFWYEYDAKILFRVVSTIEASEKWVPTSETIDQYVSDLGDILDGNVNLDLINPETIVNILTSIRFSQGLRAMHALESKKSGYIAKLLAWAESQPDDPSSPAKIFLKRNVVFERMQLCARIFAPERLNLLRKCQEVK